MKRLLRMSYLVAGLGGVGFFVMSILLLGVWPGRTLEEQIRRMQPDHPLALTASEKRGRRHLCARRLRLLPHAADPVRRKRRRALRGGHASPGRRSSITRIFGVRAASAPTLRAREVCGRRIGICRIFIPRARSSPIP